MLFILMSVILHPSAGCNRLGNNKLSGLSLRGRFMLLIINTNHSKWTNKALKNPLFVPNASVNGSWYPPARKLTGFSL